MKKLLLVTGVILCWTYACAISCYDGVAVVDGSEEENNFTISECPTNSSQACLLSKLSVVVRGFSFDLKVGRCVQSDMIAFLDCDYLFQRLREPNVFGSLNVSEFQFSNCSFTACNTSLCNGGLSAVTPAKSIHTGTSVGTTGVATTSDPNSGRSLTISTQTIFFSLTLFILTQKPHTS